MAPTGPTFRSPRVVTAIWPRTIASASMGLRVMATGQRDFDPKTFDPEADLLPLIDGLTLLAMVGIVDPPRPAAKDAIARAHGAGIQVRMITGDHAVTAKAIADQLGIEGRAITGAEFAAMSDEQAIREIDGIGVIARVAPEHKVRLVDILRKKGHVVAMTGDGVNDAPALKAADIGIAMGITGTEVSKQAAVMILTDDNFGTIVKAVELGRALYDNLLRYIRFQIAVLFGFIGTFLGASLFFILGGIPFLPLQTLWINFTVDVSQAIGLGWSKPRSGLMERPPRPRDQPMLSRRLNVWLIFCGLVMSVGTLAIIAWADATYDTATAHTMGLATFSIFHLFFSLETADPERTIFSSELLDNPMLLKTTGVSILTILLATQFGPLQQILDTVELTVGRVGAVRRRRGLDRRHLRGQEAAAHPDRRRAGGGGRRGEGRGERRGRGLNERSNTGDHVMAIRWRAPRRSAKRGRTLAAPGARST